MQWLSGRVLDSRLRGHWFEPHRRHCVVSLSKNIYPSLVLVQPRKTRPFITERLLMGRKESNQTNKQTKDPELLLGANNLDLQPHLLLIVFVGGLELLCFVVSFCVDSSFAIILIGAIVVLWINCSPYKPGVVGSIPGFRSLSDETLSRGLVSI